MKYTILLLLVSSVFLLAGCSSKPKEQTFSKPYTYSVVFKDGRTDCQKFADINFSKKWDEFCLKENRDNDCELAKTDSDSVILYHELGYQFCQRNLIFDMDLNYGV